MEELQTLAPGVVVVLKAAVLVALPIGGARLIWSLLRRLAPNGFFAVPAVYTVARVAGLGLGLILVFVHHDRRNFDLHEIFVPEGPWNISLAQFLLVRVNPINYGPIAILDRLGEGYILPFGLAAVAALLLLTLAWAWKIWNLDQARRATLCVAIIVLSTAYLTIYGISLLFWFLFLFNSWTFLLLALALNRYQERR